MSNTVQDRRDWWVMTTTRPAALGGIAAALLLIVGVTCIAGVFVLPSVPERILFGLVAAVTLAGAVAVALDLRK